MTAPFAHGYVDWTRYRVAAARVYIDATFNDVAVSPSTTTLLSAFIGDVPRISPFVRSTTGRHELFFQYYSDDPARGGTLLHQFAFILGVNRTWGHSLAVPGPWLVVLAWSDVATNELAIRVTETTQHGLTQFGSGGDDNIVLGSDFTLTANTQFFLTATQVWPGAAHFSFSVEPWVPVRYDMHAVTLDGTTGRQVLRIDRPCDQSVWGVVMLPATSVGLNITNLNTTTDAEISVALVGQLAQPGI